MTAPALPDEPADDPRHGQPIVPNDQWLRLQVPRPRRCWWGLRHRDVPYPGVPTYVQCQRCALVAPRGVRDVLTGRRIL